MLARSLPSLAALGLAALCAGTAAAAPFHILGFDDMSCQAWVRSKGDPEQRALYIAWVRGVVSGHNYALQSQQVAPISAGTVENYVQRYCSSNPRAEVSEAAFRLTDQFSGRNQPIRK